MENLNRNLMVFIFTIFLLFTAEAAPSNIIGMVLTDLTANNFSFNAQAEGWIASSYNSPPVVTSMCNDTFLVGGEGVLGLSGASTKNENFQRKYEGLPTPHNVVYFSFSFWVIDGWAGTDYVNFLFDTSYTSEKFYFPTDNVGTPYCGLPGKNEIPNVRFEGVVRHSSDTLTLKIISGVDKDSLTASFGIRDIKLTFDTITGTLPTSSTCARSPTSSFTGTRCTCTSGFYETPSNSGSCTACHTSCDKCNGAGSSACTSCPEGTFLSGGQCLQCDPSCKTCVDNAAKCLSCKPGTYQNGNTCPTCDPSCKTCVENAAKCLSCKPGTYQNGNTCPTCDPSCETCNGGSTNCLTCPTNSFMIPNQKTCLTTCVSPLTQVTTVDGVKTCTTPCASDMTKFVYWEKSCQTACDSPLVPYSNGPIKLCKYPCLPEQYLYWDGDCQNSCPMPYKIAVRNQKNFCTFQCSASQYLYADGNCTDACPFPLRSRTGDPGQQFCEYPCAPNEFLLWDQTCVSECKAPYQEKSVGTLRYCNFPCESTQYYYWNGTCSSVSCTSPLTLRQEGAGDHKRNFCDLVCESGKYLMWYGACGSNCDAPYRNATDKGLSVCKAPCDSTLPIWFEDLSACGKECIAPRVLNNSRIYPVCDKAPVPDQGGSLVYFLMNAPQVNEYSLLVPTPNMKFVKFLDSNLPPRLEKLASSQGKYLFSPRFGLSAPSSLRTNTKRLLLAEVFEKAGLDTSFLVNFWDGLLTMAIILAITLVLTLFENFLQNAKLKVLHGIVERLMVMGGFNYFLLVYASCIGEIIMYTYIEVANFSGVSAGLIIGVILTLLIIPFFGGIVYVVKKATAFGAYNLKNETADKYKKFSIRWRACQIFIRGMNSDSMVKKLFFLIYTARNVLSMLVSIFLISIPTASAIIQIIITALMIAFMIIKKPLQKKVNHVQIILFESITLLLNLCVFIVVIMGNSDNQESDFAIVLGDIIIVGTDVLNILVIIFLAIKIRLEVLSILKVLKEYPNHNKAIWINLLGVLAQQTGMGFEEVIEESSIPTSANKYIGLLLKAKSLAREKTELLKSRSQVYPDDTRKSINDTEPIIKKTELSGISNIQINGERASELNTNSDLTNNMSLSPPKLQTRVKSVISNISLKKQGTEQNLNISPTFSIDLSDNSPIIRDNALLLKQASSIESPVQTNAPGGIFFPTDITDKNSSSRPMSSSNNDNKGLLNLTPVLPPVIEKAIEETKPIKIADEVGLDDYLKQFGLLSEDSNKASSNINRKNLSRSPTLKSKKTLR